MTTSAFFAGAVAIVLSGLLMFGTRKVADVDEAEAVGAGV
jgi:hypothetical protein